MIWRNGKEAEGWKKTIDVVFKKKLHDPFAYTGEPGEIRNSLDMDIDFAVSELLDHIGSAKDFIGIDNNIYT
jgi:hypothetical protein